MGIMANDEVSIWWCLGDTWRCTPAEAVGLWSVILFYVTMLLVTVIHAVHQNVTGSADRNEGATRMYMSGGDDGFGMLCFLVLYFFTFAAGCLLWAAAGVHYVHPVQMWQVQLVGAAVLVACTFLFITVHVQMGENWSPEPEQKARHQLITGGIFRWARHPMYAILLWASVGTLLATLNWLIAWCVFGAVPLLLWRIETEERILVGLYGEEYHQYCQRVSALGPPWHFLGFDRDLHGGNSAYEKVC